MVVRLPCLEENDWQDKVDDKHGKVEQSADCAVEEAHADAPGIQA